MRAPQLEGPEQPSSADISRFLHTFEVLDRFEAQQRLMRGYGAFNPAELPRPGVKVTLDWLKKLAGWIG